MVIFLGEWRWLFLTESLRKRYFNKKIIMIIRRWIWILSKRGIIHLQVGRGRWNAITVLCYMALPTVVFVGYLPKTCHRACAFAKMPAV